MLTQAFINYGFYLAVLDLGVETASLGYSFFFFHLHRTYISLVTINTAKFREVQRPQFTENWKYRKANDLLRSERFLFSDSSIKDRTLYSLSFILNDVLLLLNYKTNAFEMKCKRMHWKQKHLSLKPRNTFQM